MADDKQPTSKQPTRAKGKKRGRGRPKGSRTKATPVVEAAPSSCPRCGSTEREPYFNAREHAIDGVAGGRVYTHVVWRRTRCKACGQQRDDRAYENRS